MLLLLLPSMASAEPSLDLPLLRCARLALQGNSQIRVRRIEVIEASREIRTQRAAFFPTLGAGFQFGRVKQATAFDYLDSDGIYSMTQLNYSGALSGSLPTGMTYQLKLDSTVTWSDATATFISPRHINSIELKLTQPLFAGNWAEAGSKLDVARVDKKVSLQRVRVQISDVLLRVIKAYWTLVAQRERNEIARKSLELAQAQLKATKVRVRAGNLSRLDLIEAKAAIAARRQALVTAEQAVLSAEKDLMLLIYYRSGPNSGSVDLQRRLHPVDRPKVSTETRPLKELVAKALRKRPELLSIAEQIRSGAIALRAAEHSAYPKVDLEATAGLASLAGTCVESTGACNAAAVGNHGTAWKQVFTAKQPYIFLGLSFALPLSSDARRAAAIKAHLAMRKLLAQRGGLEARVAVEVRDAYLRLKRTNERLTAAERGMTLAEQNLDAQRKKFKGGIATSFDVLRVQLQLAQAQRNVVEARKDNVVARAEVEYATGNLLRHVGIDIR